MPRDENEQHRPRTGPPASRPRTAIGSSAARSGPRSRRRWPGSRWWTCTRTSTPRGFGTPVPNATRKTDPAGLMLWGVDELVTYHYLIAEVYRVVPARPAPLRAVLGR